MVAEKTPVGFDGLRVVAFESRLAEQMRQLIARHGGRPIVAPSMREVPLEQNADVLRFGERLVAGEFAMVISQCDTHSRAFLLDARSRWERVYLNAAASQPGGWPG